jgi:AraC family transcriptional regulator, regulatory protein of adaptative response / DNA-3-methyladenine glycosylase II
LLPGFSALVAVSDFRQLSLRPGGRIENMTAALEPTARGVRRDTERRYRAVTSRDARFDGQFIMAVRTAGIILPAVLPRPDSEAEERELLPHLRGGTGRSDRNRAAASPTPFPARRSGMCAPTWPPARCGLISDGGVARRAGS